MPSGRRDSRYQQQYLPPRPASVFKEVLRHDESGPQNLETKVMDWYGEPFVHIAYRGGKPLSVPKNEYFKMLMGGEATLLLIKKCERKVAEVYAAQGGHWVSNEDTTEKGRYFVVGVDGQLKEEFVEPLSYDDVHAAMKKQFAKWKGTPKPSTSSKRSSHLGGGGDRKKRRHQQQLELEPPPEVAEVPSEDSGDEEDLESPITAHAIPTPRNNGLQK